MEDLELLIASNAEIFNITPPNTKGPDKFQDQEKYEYQLVQKYMNPLWRKKWRSFKGSTAPQKISSKVANGQNEPFSAEILRTQNREIDPFSEDWSFSNETEEQKQQQSEFQENDLDSHSELVLDQKLYQKLENLTKTDPI